MALDDPLWTLHGLDSQATRKAKELLTAAGMRYVHVKGDRKTPVVKTYWGGYRGVGSIRRLLSGCAGAKGL